MVLIPLVTFFILLILWDPFKIFFSANKYYHNIHYMLNREHISLELLERSNKNDSVSNFIFGNSRSQAFKTEDWNIYIRDKSGSFFHYDGSDFGLYRTRNIFNYLNKSGMHIKNVLLIIDLDFFKELSNPTDIVHIQPPKVSNQTVFIYYLKFLKYSFNFDFVSKYILYYFFSKSSDLIYEYPIYNKHNLTSNDVYFTYDSLIHFDSLNYYRERIVKNIFYKRSNELVFSKCLITHEHVLLLNDIFRVLKEQGTNYKIVISPLYNQIKMEPTDLSKLVEIFGKNNVYDYSGKNTFTNSISNYYEGSHYRPVVAREILKEIYMNKIIE